MNIRDLLKDAYKEGMTIEEIESALEGIELPTDNSAELEKLKNALSKSNSEAADYKRQLKEKMTADEIKAKEDAERQEKLQKDYDELVKKVAISDNKAKLLGLGYDDALAKETGCTVTQDIGDGYTAVYGQLKELNFDVGDMVESGQVVGYVGEPTKYYSVEGSNVYFQILKDGVPVDPVEILP